MSVKGTTKELFVGKQEVKIITLMGNKITLSYSDMKRIDYHFATTLQIGYIHFIENDNTITKFEFKKASNDAVHRTIDFVNENCPTLLTNEFSADERRNNKAVQFVPTFGHKELGLSGISNTMHQRPDDTIFFNNNTASFYYLVGYEWEGALYDEITNSMEREHSESDTKKKGKALKIGAGAIIGSALGPMGTAVGAAMGAGSRGKSKTIGSSLREIQGETKRIEIDTKAILAFQSIDTEKIYKLSVKCNSTLDAKIKCLNFK